MIFDKRIPKNGIQILKLFKGKVNAVRIKIQVWVVWDDEDEINGCEKIFSCKWNKQVDGSWQKGLIYKIIS